MTSVKAFGEVVYIAGDVREFADALDAAVREDGAPSRAQRQAVARQYSWEEIVRRKSEVVAAALAGNNPVVGSHGDTA
jgi:glycosyltransferase involved in cell wall biosynthesis